MQPTLTVVVPTLNEEARLPVLLTLLEAQSRRPDAVVIADAGSTDATRAIAEACGALVVEGGKPAAGRNAGAAASKTDLVLFLDADDEPDQGWIELAVEEFEERGLAVAAGQVEPIERDPANLFACEVVNLYLQLTQYASPHAPGFCILIRRELHTEIGGFDETVVLAEDHEYVQRAAELGKFRILRSAPMRTSMRRIAKEGLITLAFKYLYSEFYVLRGKPVKQIPFEYEFAAFSPDAERPPLVDLQLARRQLEKLAEEVAELPVDVLERLRALGEAELPLERLEQLIRQLEPEELHELREVVAHRMDVARRMPRVMLWRARRMGDKAWRRLTEPAR